MVWNRDWVHGGHLYGGLESKLGTWGTPIQWLGIEAGYMGAQLLMYAQVL